MKEYLFNIKFLENIYNQINNYRVEAVRIFLLKLRSKIDNILLELNNIEKENEDLDSIVYQSLDIFEVINGC